MLKAEFLIFFSFVTFVTFATFISFIDGGDGDDGVDGGDLGDGGEMDDQLGTSVKLSPELGEITFSIGKPKLTPVEAPTFQGF